MIPTRHRGYWVILLTLIAALGLTIIPLPSWAQPHRPDWVLLVLLYWCMALPTRVGVGTAWSLGLLLDVLTGTLLGQHGLGLAVVAFVVLKLHQRIRVYPIWQQALSVCMLLALNQLFMLWVNGVLGRPAIDWVYWSPSLIGMLLWPWMFILLRDLRRRFRVN
jgi:rod shape-determining protein MreD